MKLLILARDGVINEATGGCIRSVDEWHAIPGSLEAIAKANGAGYQVVVATNQQGLASKQINIDILDAIHQKLYTELNILGGHIDAIFFCPHGPQEGCECRKPHPGMLLDIAARYHSDLQGIPFIGSSMRDIEAARAAGADPMLVRTGDWPEMLSKVKQWAGIPVYENLATAVDVLQTVY